MRSHRSPGARMCQPGAGHEKDIGLHSEREGKPLEASTDLTQGLVL